MAVENETAEQVVKMVLQGTEVVLRISGEAAINIAKMIYSVLKNDRTSRGRATLWEFLKSGKDQKIFQIPDEYLKPFTTASKKYGFPFVVLKDKNNANGVTDIMVYASDAAKVNRVIETLQLTVKKVENIKSTVNIPGKADEYMTFGKELKVPFELIDDIPSVTDNKRIHAQAMRLAAKMKTSGPQIVERVGLLCKENGHYETISSEAKDTLLAMRLAGYKDVVADILIPNCPVKEMEEKTSDGQLPRERNDSPMTGTEPAPVEKAKDVPSKEEGQTVNPTMARTANDIAFGQDLEKSSVSESKEGKIISEVFGDKRPSVRAELERCRMISEANEALKAVQKATKTIAKPNPMSK